MLNETDFATVLAAERARLVRLCASVTGESAAAEDLAQETLLEAWRNRAKLITPDGHARWLNAIAHNVCLRWRRAEGRRSAERNDLSDEQAAGDDLLHELEHHELATLLDRALAMLPANTRAAMVQHYIEALPQAQIAAVLGLSEGAVAVRVHRGKLALRRLLANELRAEAETFSLIHDDDPASGWHETRIWCPECGQQRLLGQLDPIAGYFCVRCPICSPAPGLEICRVEDRTGLFYGIKGFKAAYNRAMDRGHRYYRGALALQHTGLAPCWECGRSIPISLAMPHYDPEIHPSLRGQPGVYLRCDCRGVYRRSSTSPRALALHLPAGQRFWRKHPRIRKLPERSILVDGRTALVVGFESVTDNARLEIVSLSDTFEVLGIYGGDDAG
jgi:RNA polymerase sigma-70 factor (ECF subfamily)